MAQKGKIIALYGVNNVGKTTQREMLEKTLRAAGQQCMSFKYARYEIEPSGTMLNAYLRSGNPHVLTAREFQTIQVINRMQVEPQLIELKELGHTIIVEDYTGTGIAWGIGAGVSKEYLLEINKHLLKEDISILLDGIRYTEGIEAGHVHENDGSLSGRVRKIHRDLATEFGWHTVNANQTRQKVYADIWDILENHW